MIVAKNISKSFQKFKALDDISLNIPKGSIFGLVGANGAGKSTMFRILTGVYKPDKGEVSIGDATVYDQISIKEKIHFVPDELYFLPGASVKQMAKFYEGMYPSFNRGRYETLVKMFGLDSRKSIHSFSKGMKRQAAILLALACSPKYLFLDETFDGLDPVVRNMVKSAICQYVEEDEMTVILSSHSLRELEGLCDKLALLYQGKIAFVSDVEDIQSSFFKVQVAYSKEYDESEFNGIDVLKYSRQGIVSNLIVKGDRDETLKYLKEREPVVLEMIPMSLEEVFTYELGAKGYTFDMELLDKGDDINEKSHEESIG